MQFGGVIMLNIGIIGTGSIANMHAEGMIREADVFKIKSACDIDAKRLKDFGRRFGITELYSDYRKIIDDPEIDAVIVLLPHNYHEPVCIEAMNAGKHVLVEKPIARTLQEADNIIKTAETTGVTLMVAHNQRFFPAHRYIRELLEQGVLGKLFCARVDHYQNFIPPQGSWWRSREAVGGGCVIGSGIHRLDLLRWYLGKIEEVFAYQVEDKERLEAEVACVAVIKFCSGAIGEFLCNWGVHRSPYGESLSLFGKDGSIYLTDMNSLYVVDSKMHMTRVDVVDTYDSMWAHFAKCITSGCTPITNGLEARRSLELALAINCSANTGKPIKLS